MQTKGRRFDIIIDFRTEVFDVKNTFLIQNRIFNEENHLKLSIVYFSGAVECRLRKRVFRTIMEFSKFVPEGGEGGDADRSRVPKKRIVWCRTSGWLCEFFFFFNCQYRVSYVRVTDDTNTKVYRYTRDRHTRTACVNL